MSFVTYLTVYNGDKLPPYYIGSSSEDRIESGYHGSVVSKEYGESWKSELKENPHMFETIIISKHHDRKEAYREELKLQKEHSVVKNPLFINLSYAQKDGYFGMFSKEHRKNIAEAQKKKTGKNNQAWKGYYHTPFGKFVSTNEMKEKFSGRWQSVYRWCKNSDKLITVHSTKQSDYLNKGMIGKTFKEMGFWFEEVTNGS